MSPVSKADNLSRSLIFSFSSGLFSAAFKVMKRAMFERRNWAQLSSEFGELYSTLWDFAEHSISHDKFCLPTAMGEGPANRVNELLRKLYGGRYASLSFGGSSGALLTILIAVLPKLQKTRDLILFDDLCHQSTIGGIIFGRWKALRAPRFVDPEHKTAHPLKFEAIKNIIQTNDPSRIAAIVLVSPTYDGFQSPTELQKIYAFAKAQGIIVIIDGAWDSVRFQESWLGSLPLDSICDIWISSPHKRGLTPSSLGCMITQDENIARLWDEALDLGFRSSSVSFVQIMVAEHRLQKVIDGDWDWALSKNREGATLLRKQIKDVHPDLYCVEPEHVSAEVTDISHILINTSRLANIDARVWAKILSSKFGFDVEKATESTLLLICGSPTHADRIAEIKSALTSALSETPRKKRLS